MARIREKMQTVGFGGRLNLGCERAESWDDSQVSDLRNRVTCGPLNWMGSPEDREVCFPTWLVGGASHNLMSSRQLHLWMKKTGRGRD